MYKKIGNFNIVINLSLILIIISSLTYSIFTHKYIEERAVFNHSGKDNIIHEDLNGDDKKDTIVVKTSSSGFTAHVNLNKDENYNLICDKSIPSLGQYYNYWPIRITTLDLSRDNSKEIIIQSSLNDKAIQHIFSWNGSGYTDIFCSENNLIGFIDSCNSKTPKLISGNFSNGTIALRGYYYNGGSIKEFKNSLIDNFPALDTLSNFICVIESFPDAYLTIPNYFYSQISTNDLETIYRLANSSNYYKFQDGYFVDLAWNEAGKITCENWILNFKTVSTQDKDKIGNITINLMINKYEDNDFPYKITSVNVY